MDETVKPVIKRLVGLRQNLDSNGFLAHNQEPVFGVSLKRGTEPAGIDLHNKVWADASRALPSKYATKNLELDW